jgi:hypothetical protein
MPSKYITKLQVQISQLRIEAGKEGEEEVVSDLRKFRL